MKAPVRVTVTGAAGDGNRRASTCSSTANSEADRTGNAGCTRRAGGDSDRATGSTAGTQSADQACRAAGVVPACGRSACARYRSACAVARSAGTASYGYRAAST